MSRIRVKWRVTGTRRIVRTTVRRPRPLTQAELRRLIEEARRKARLSGC